MMYVMYAVVALFAAAVLAAVLVPTFQVIRRKIALSGLTREQYELITSLSKVYSELSRRKAEARQREESILIQGGPFTDTCRKELWSSSEEQKKEVARLEQQCQEAGIAEWRINCGVLEGLLVE